MMRARVLVAVMLLALTGPMAAQTPQKKFMAAPASAAPVWVEPCTMITGHPGPDFRCGISGVRDGSPTSSAGASSTYVVDQSGRGRSGFDQSVLHEAEARINSGDPKAATELIPNFGRITDNGAWTAWFGHLLPAGSNVTTGKLIRHGDLIIATHSQSGIMGHHAARILKEKGTLNLLKGLITIEGGCSLPNSGLSAADFDAIPYLALKGDYTATSAQCQETVDAINKRRAARQGSARADYMKLDEMGILGVTHMMMLDSNSNQIADLMIDWVAKNVAKAPRR
jgi:hypothetical protein